MTRNDPRIWFRPKRIGFGWSPNTWEGWVLTGALVVAILLAARLLR